MEPAPPGGSIKYDYINILNNNNNIMEDFIFYLIESSSYFFITK